MDIRQIDGTQFNEFMEVARGNVENVVLPTLINPSMQKALRDYVSPEKLAQGMQTGSIALWGAYDSGRMVAVSAMETNGHITMLYVTPYWQKKKIAKALLETMKTFARERLGLTRVTVNAMPATSATYFKKRGFAELEQQLAPMDFVSLWSDTKPFTDYERKKVSTGQLLVCFLLPVVIALLAVVIFVII